MLHRFVPRIMAMFFVIALVVSASGVAWAAGTTAGTTITNSTSVSYNDQNANAMTPATGSVSFYVAHKVVINWPGTQAQSVESGDKLTRYYAFSFVNNTNGTDNFNISTPTIPGGWTVTIYNDLNSNGSLDANEDDSVNTHTGDLAADATAYIILKIDIPANQTDNSDPTIVFRAQSTKAQNLPTYPVANLNHSEDMTLTVQIRKPVITVTVANAATLSSASNQIPGSSVTYDIMVANTGTRALSGQDTIWFKWNATYTTTPTGTGGADNGSYYYWEITSLAAGTGTVTKNVTVPIEQTSNNGTGPASATTVTVPTTDIYFSYDYAGASLTKNASGAGTFDVDEADGVNLTEYLPKDQNISPTSSATYYFYLKNVGNASNTFNLVRDITDTSGTVSGTPFVYYISSNYNANPALASYDSVTATDANTDPSSFATTGSIGAGVERWVKIVVTIPSGTLGTATRTFDYSATAVTQINPANTFSYTDAVTSYKFTVTAPYITVSFGAPYIVSQPNDANGDFTGNTNFIPGTVVRYEATISNVGNDTAKTLVSTHNALLNQVLIDFSVDLDPNGDGTYVGGDSGKGEGGSASDGTVTMTVTTFSGSNVVISVNRLLSGAAAKYRYQATIQ